MAIDTAAKRSSSLDHEEPWQWGAPLPDGTIGQGDRQHSIWSYSGILAGAASAASATASWAYVIFAGNKGHASFKGNKGHVTTNDQP